MALDLEERIKPYTTFLTERGRLELVQAIGKWREAYGKDWLEEMRRVTPTTCEVVDLCANKTFEQTWEEINRRVDEWIDEEESSFAQLAMIAGKDLMLNAHRANIQVLHAAIREEIDRKRF
jgi:hypothetical protein